MENQMENEMEAADMVLYRDPNIQIMENDMDKKVDNDMEAGDIGVNHVGIQVYKCYLHWALKI